MVLLAIGQVDPPGDYGGVCAPVALDRFFPSFFIHDIRHHSQVFVGPAAVMQIRTKTRSHVTHPDP